MPPSPDSQVPCVKRTILQRLLGKPATGLPADVESWFLMDNRIILELEQVPELFEPGGAVRLEGEGLDWRVLVFADSDGRFHAVHNDCSHGHRRLDPVPGEELLQCCSMGKSTYTFAGGRVAGATKESLLTFPCEYTGARLIVHLPTESDTV